MIMQYFSGAWGLRGWQWMFLLEGLPAVILGIVVLCRLEDHASQAKWLTEEEKIIITRNIDEEQKTKIVHPSLLSVFKDGLLLFFGLIYIACTMSQTGLGMWVPTLVEKVGLKNLFAVGVVSAFPYFVAAICMWFVGVHADKTRERRWHFAIPAFIGALGLFVIPSTANNLPLAALAITFGAVGAVTSVAMFWSLPTAIFGGASAAAGLALINSVGNLGGFAGPFVVGWLVDVTQKTNAGMYALASVLLAGGLLVILALPKKLVNK
jgi:MFS family permease